jgi:hypothetical protein
MEICCGAEDRGAIGKKMRVTDDLAKIRITEENSPVEVRRKNAKTLGVQRIRVSEGLSGKCIDQVSGRKP